MRKATAAKRVTDELLRAFKKSDGTWPLTAQVHPPHVVIILHANQSCIPLDATEALLETLFASSRLSRTSLIGCSLRGQEEVCTQLNTVLSSIHCSLRPQHLLQEITAAVSTGVGLDAVLLNFGLYRRGRWQQPLLILENWPLSCFLSPETVQRALAKAAPGRRHRLKIHRPLEVAA